MQHAADEIFGRFVPIRFHARGGLGEVLLAQDTELGRSVALKRILEHAADDPDAHRRFVLEAEITGRLEHPGIVPVYGLGLDPRTQQPYYAMRFITGRSLKSAIDDFHKTDGGFDGLAFRKLLASFISVCQTIGFAHSRGVLHRDLKPANVMVGEFGETLVVDWGLAKVLGGATPAASSDARAAPPSERSPDGSGSSGSESSTRADSVLGTPGYLSPEQGLGEVEKLGPATDVYGLGAMLYHLVSGRTPLEDKPSHARVMNTIAGLVPPPLAVNPAVPRALDAVCRKAMATAVGERYISAEALAEDVQRYLADEPVTCHRESLSSRARRWVRRHPTTVTGVAAALLAGGVAAAVGVGALNLKNAELSTLNATLSDKNVELDRLNGQLATTNATLDSRNTELQRSIAAEKSARAVAERRLDVALQAIKTCLDVARQDLLTKPGVELERFKLMSAAVPLREQLAEDEQSVNALIELAYAYHQAGYAFSDIRSPKEAIPHFTRAVELFQRIVTRYPQHPQQKRWRATLAEGHSHLGELHARNGDYATAEAEIRTSIAGYRAILAEVPNDVLNRRELIIVSNQLGAVALRAKRPGLAAEALRDSIRDAESFLREHSEKREHAQHTEQVRRALAGAHADLASALSDLKQPDDARQHYQTALELFLAATGIKGNSGSRRDRSWLASICNNFGSFLTSQRETAAAEAQFRRAVELHGGLHRESPAVLEHRANLASSQFNLAGTLFMQNRLNEAEKEYRASLELHRTVAKTPGIGGPSISAWRTTCRLLAMLLAVRSAASADAAARERDAAEAVALLAEAGPTVAGIVRSEKAFDALRSRDDMQKLLADWAKPKNR